MLEPAATVVLFFCREGRDKISILLRRASSTSQALACHKTLHVVARLELQQ
jgi:hypothetical protein